MVPRATVVLSAARPTLLVPLILRSIPEQRDLAPIVEIDAHGASARGRDRDKRVGIDALPAPDAPSATALKAPPVDIEVPA